MKVNTRALSAALLSWPFWAPSPSHEWFEAEVGWTQSSWLTYKCGVCMLHHRHPIISFGFTCSKWNSVDEKYLLFNASFCCWSEGNCAVSNSGPIWGPGHCYLPTKSSVAAEADLLVSSDWFLAVTPLLWHLNTYRGCGEHTKFNSCTALAYVFIEHLE